MPKKPAPSVPSIEPLNLVDLDDGDPSDLVSHAMRDGQRYADADLSGQDLTGISFTECELAGATAHETQFRAARFVSSRIERMNAPVFLASRSTFRDAEILSSRIGSAELYDADVQATSITGCKLGWVNLRSARLQDVRFTGCTIDELDLANAR